MKLKNKVLWVFAGGILLVLLLFLEQQFFQTRKKQIAVILSEDAVSDFCAFQEGIYDGAEDCVVSLRIIHTPELSENAWAELLSAQKKQGCDGVLLFVRNNTTPEAKSSMPKHWSNARSLFSLSPMHLHFSTVLIAMAWNSSPRSYPRKSKRQHRVRSKLPQIPRRQRVRELRSLWSSV